MILNLVDASNIERNLYLTTQLTEVGIPVVVALNMIDVVKRNGDTIDTAKLSKMLGCPVIETAAVKGQGTMEAASNGQSSWPRKRGRPRSNIALTTGWNRPYPPLET